MYPLPFPAGGDDTGLAEVGEVTGDFGLPLLQDFDEVADADLSTFHQVEQTEAGRVGECSEDLDEIDGLGAVSHTSNIYALTNVFREDIFAKAYMKEVRQCRIRQRFRRSMARLHGV